MRLGNRPRVYLSLRMQMLNANAKFVTPSFEWSLEWRLREGRGRAQDAGGEICGKVTSRASAGVFAYNYVVVAVVAKYRTR